MNTSNGTPQRARWQVCWLGKSGKIQRKDFEHNFSEALDLYGKLVVGERKFVTLRCCNISFPPPDKFADREEVVVIRNGKRYKGQKMIEPRMYHERMHGANVKGAWWCPYCIKMRKFVRRNFTMFEGIRINEASMNCPVCGISHRDCGVQRYNPIAVRYNEMRRTRSDKGVGR